LHNYNDKKRVSCPLLILALLLGLQILCNVLLAQQYDGVTSASKLVEPYDEAKLAYVASQFKASQSPLKLRYERKIAQALQAKLPILALDDLANDDEKKAQQIVLNHADVKASAKHPQTGDPLRTEVMTVMPALPGDRVRTQGACWEGACYRVNLYNFFFNATISVLVDVKNEKVVNISSLPESQPELSKRLKALAIDITKSEAAVRYEVGRYLKFIGETKTPEQIKPVMVDTKSALKDTLCERSKHLCVAPTYVLGDMSLWVIVDLTDLKVAGLRWTKVGHAGPESLITERLLENEYVFKNFCEQVSKLERNGWRFDYHITSSDGLRIANAKYNDKPVFESAKVVDWHVSYSNKDKFGYSDATGCPVFSSAVVVAYDGPQFAAISDQGEEVGFSITQQFQQHSWPAPCNYRYDERYEFYNDGRFRVAMISHGRGCGSNGVYRPVFRLSWGPRTNAFDYSFEQWAQGWKSVEQESWVRQAEPDKLNDNKYSHRLVSSTGGGFLIEPSDGQLGDGSRGDDAYIYITVDHPDKDEGANDMVTLGSCCNTNHEQGPEQFMAPAETLAERDLVFWYVPQMKNDGQKGQEYCWAENYVDNGVLKTKTWPCVAGPMFTPIKQ